MRSSEKASPFLRGTCVGAHVSVLAGSAVTRQRDALWLTPHVITSARLIDRVVGDILDRHKACGYTTNHQTG